MIDPPVSDEKEYSGKILLRMPKMLHKFLAERAHQEGVSINKLLNVYLAYGLGADAEGLAKRNPD
jgi:antitoxin HicB